jgi:hypothetical protein
MFSIGNNRKINSIIFTRDTFGSNKDEYTIPTSTDVNSRYQYKINDQIFYAVEDDNDCNCFWYYTNTSKYPLYVEFAKENYYNDDTTITMHYLIYIDEANYKLTLKAKKLVIENEYYDEEKKQDYWTIEVVPLLLDLEITSHISYRLDMDKRHDMAQMARSSWKYSYTDVMEDYGAYRDEDEYVSEKTKEMSYRQNVILNIQFYIRFLEYALMRKNLVYAPNNLGGKFIKKQLLAMVSY